MKYVHLSLKYTMEDKINVWLFLCVMKRKRNENQEIKREKRCANTESASRR